MTRSIMGRTGRLGSVVLAVVLLSGCGGAGKTTVSSPSVAASPIPSASATPTPSPSPSSATPTPTSTSTPTPTPTKPAVAECRAVSLKVSLKDGGGAAGSVYSEIVLTNTGSAPCWIRGYGGVSYVTGAGGTRIGAPAARDHSMNPARVLLQPGAGAAATLQEGEALNYPKNLCQPTKAAGLRIYPPDETHALYLAHSTTGCANPKTVTMNLGPYVAKG